MPGSAEGDLFMEEANDTVNFVKQLHAAQGSTVTAEDVEQTATCAKSGDLEGIVSTVLSRLDSVFAHADEDGAPPPLDRGSRPWLTQRAGTASPAPPAQR